MPLVIVGIGVDLIAIERIKRMLEDHGERFVDRVFTEGEIAYCRKMKYSEEHFAGRFAAKEAVSKALGTGIGARCGWKEIEVVRNAVGKPGIRLSGGAAETASRLGVDIVHVSLSHTRGNSVACAVAESFGGSVKTSRGRDAGICSSGEGATTQAT